MKQFIQCILTGLLVSIALLSKAQVITSNSDNTDQLNMKGAYSMLRQVANDGTSDSMMSSEQFKIYTDRYILYVRPITGDSLAAYGIGTYEIRNGKVKEYVFHTSSDGAVKDTFELNIYKMGNGYKQTIHFTEADGRRWTLIEDYMNVGKGITTPLDGAWKQTKVTYVMPNGKKQTENNPTQFKVFESGHFAWVRTQKDSASGKPVSYYGYGSFDMDGAKKFVEINASSTFRTMLKDVPVPIQLEFPAKDVYRQTIVYPDGAKMIEEYKKLK